MSESKKPSENETQSLAKPRRKLTLEDLAGVVGGREPVEFPEEYEILDVDRGRAQAERVE
jgi:hypothetical protein